jgi:hypothetical protein
MEGILMFTQIPYGDGVVETSQYGWNLFKAILEIKSEHVKLWTARHSGRIISGILTFQAPRHVVAWHAATLATVFTFGHSTISITKY